MDKFGIFKLLNSFLGSGKDQNSFSSTNGSDFLTSALNNIIPNQQPNNNPPTPIKTEKPLQSNMLFTMRSHDEFVKRVKQKNT